MSDTALHPSEWLTANAAADDYTFPRSCLWRWRLKGCPLLGGKKPRTRLIRFNRTGPGRRRVVAFHRGDLEAATVARAAGGRGPDQEDGWLSATEAAERFGWSVATVYLWAERGEPLTGWQLESQLRTVLQADGRPRSMRVFSLDQLQRINKARESAKTDGHDPDWITASEAAAQLGLDPNYLYKWHKRGCPHLAGRRKLGSRRVCGPGRSVAWKVRQFNRRQLEEIARSIGESGFETGLRDAEGNWLPASIAETRYDIWTQHLERWRQEPCSFLGGSPIRAKQVPCPSRTRHGGMVWVYHEEDLKAIKVARAAPTVYRDGEGVWLFASEVEGRFGLRADNLWHYRKKPWAALGGRTIRAKQVPAASHPRPRNAHGGLLWVYHEEDLRRLHHAAPEPLEPAAAPPPPTPEVEAGTKYPGHIKKMSRTGRPADRDTEAVLEYCYDQYITVGHSRKDVYLAARQRFGKENAPREIDDVKTYAKRWALRFEPPLSLDRPGKS
jgi:hypothetical protein